MTDKEHLDNLIASSQRIVESQHRRKLIVAGPGAGKTTSFKKLLENRRFVRGNVLTLTFLGNLKTELEKDLGQNSVVFTFHGYCYHLLRRYRNLRNGLGDNFIYFPEILDLIKEDWEINQGSVAPVFTDIFRSNQLNESSRFYLGRSEYYNAIGYDDSVFRVYHAFSSVKSDLSYDLILVDEFQDFNKLEVDFVRLLTDLGPVVIAGDDDQALYEKMRLADARYIQALYADPNYENLLLPYCTRCPKVIVDASKDFLEICEVTGVLQGRIKKTFEYCPPIKRVDSEQYPFIELVRTSIQSPKANFFGRYIEQQIRNIPIEDIRESREKGFLTALVISSNPFRRQVEDYLANLDFEIQRVESYFEPATRETALRGLREDPDSNLWWRLILHFDKPRGWKKVVRASISGDPLVWVILNRFKEKILNEASSIPNLEENRPTLNAANFEKPTVKITSFEGSKGLSAAHVYIAGMQNGTLPQYSNAATKIEAKKFFVALTRTRKHCHILYSTNVGGRSSNPSVFLDWIKSNRKHNIYADKYYFAGNLSS